MGLKIPQKLELEQLCKYVEGERPPVLIQSSSSLLFAEAHTLHSSAA